MDCGGAGKTEPMATKVNYRKLNAAQFFALRDAILDSFDEDEIDEVFRTIGQRRLRVLVPAKAFQFMVNDLIDKAMRGGWLDRLVAGLKQKSQNLAIQDLESTLRMFDVEGHPTLAGGSLERTVKEKAGFSDFAPWVKELSLLRRRICRIEYPTPEGDAFGTGFLVGADRILTNYHVVNPPGATAPDPSTITCRFDYAVEDGVTSKGKTVALDVAGWNIKQSPYSQVDPGDSGGLPGENELDFALLKLAQPIGEETIQADPRGWIDLTHPAPAPVAGDILFIVQHPKGDPLKLAIGATKGMNGNGTRVRYDANTEGGSSGSPCFDTKLRLVALHHGGDPDYWRPAEYNQGIPIALIGPRIAG